MRREQVEEQRAACLTPVCAPDGSARHAGSGAIGPLGISAGSSMEGSGGGVGGLLNRKAQVVFPRGLFLVSNRVTISSKLPLRH